MKFLRAVAWVAVGPAVYVNVEAAQSSAWLAAGVFFVVMAAVFVYLAWSERSFLFGMLAAVFISINLANAIGNVASLSDATRDGRSSAIQHNDDIKGKRTALKLARKAQFDIAGEDAAETIEGRLQGLIASDATRWTQSEHCNPDKITRPETRTFCDKIGQAKAKKAAAEARAKIDEKLTGLDDKEATAAPSAADPFAESVARFLVLLGYTVDDNAKALISTSRDWLRSIGLELLAAFGPMALDLIFERMFGSQPIPVRASGRNREIVRPREELAPVPSIPLPAVPHVTAAEASPSIMLPEEPAQVAKVDELEADEPIPLPPSPPRRKQAKKQRKPRLNPVISGPGATIIPFAKRPSHSEVLALIVAGKTQREVADQLGMGVRTVGRIVADFKTGQTDAESAIS
jgi:hypothetical protein